MSVDPVTLQHVLRGRTCSAVGYAPGSDLTGRDDAGRSLRRRRGTP
jgi:hypothetical protein